MKKQLKLINSNKNWVANGRYNVNTVVSFEDVDYQNITGSNSIPSDLIDWILVNEIGTFVGNQEYKTADFTAENDFFYTIGGSTSTVTDPTPIEGKGYIVFPIRGSAVISGVTYGVGTLVYRYYSVVGWINVEVCKLSQISAINTSLATKVEQGINNSTTVALTSANLNSAYPDAETGFRVYCTAIIAGKMVYEKTPTGWVGMAAIVP